MTEIRLASSRLSAATSDEATSRAGAATAPPTREDFRFLAENAPDMISRHSPDGTFSYVSPACRTLLGYAPSEMLGRSAYDFMHPDDRSAVRLRHAAILDGAGSVSACYRFVRKNGTHVLCESTGRGIFGEGGEVTEIVVVSRDLTGRVEDQNLRRQWELCFDQTKRGISVVDPETGLLISVNPALAKMHGGTVADFVGRPLEFLFAEESARRLPRLTAEVEMKGYIEYESNHVRLDGTTFPVRTEVMAACDEDGRFLYRIGWYHDLSAEREAEHERELAQRDFETAFTYAPNGVAIVDLDGRFVRVNGRFCQILGYEAAELEGMEVEEITHPDDLERDRVELARLRAGKATSYELEKRYYTKRGHLIWIALAVALVRDEDDQPLHFIGQVEDISQRKRLEEDLHELASRDLVTSLWNRRRFEEELERQVARCHRYGEQAALLLIDLDGFKAVNDRGGHKDGDRLLRAIGEELTRTARDSDIVSRVGGDEFAVLLLNVDEQQAAQVADDLRDGVAAVAGERGVSASTGMVQLVAGVPEPAECYAVADAAMYDAKKDGGNRVVTRELPVSGTVARISDAA